MLQNQINEISALLPTTLEELGLRYDVPTFELQATLTNEASLSGNDRIFAACELSCIARRAILQDQLTFEASKALFQKVVEIFKSFSNDEFTRWFLGRDEGDFGIHKDFVALEQRFGQICPGEVRSILEEFRRVAREKLSDPNFDIIADALDRRTPTFLGTLFYHRKASQH